MVLITIFINMSESLIVQYIGFSYIDEFTCLILGFYAGLLCIVNKRILLSNEEKLIFILVIILYMIGTLSTVIYDYQNNIGYGLLSGIFTIKSFLCYFFARICFRVKLPSKRRLKRFLVFLEFILISLSVLTIADRVFKLYPPHEFRFGVETTALIFNHPTELAFYIITILLLSHFLIRYLALNTNNYYLILAMGIIIVFMTGRIKAIAFIIIFIFYLLISPFVKKMKLSYLVFLAPLILYLSWDRISTSLLGSGEARGTLYTTALKIANEHFPLGAGFATFGTEFSRRSYSILYSKYNIDNVWGLSLANNSYIADTTWPAILGETGYLGTIVTILFFIFLIKMITAIKIEKYIKNSLILFIIYVLIESSSESILMSSRGVSISIIIALLINLSIKERVVSMPRLKRDGKNSEILLMNRHYKRTTSLT